MLDPVILLTVEDRKNASSEPCLASKGKLEVWTELLPRFVGYLVLQSAGQDVYHAVRFDFGLHCCLTLAGCCVLLSPGRDLYHAE